MSSSCHKRPSKNDTHLAPLNAAPVKKTEADADKYDRILCPAKRPPYSCLSSCLEILRYAAQGRPNFPRVSPPAAVVCAPAIQ